MYIYIYVHSLSFHHPYEQKKLILTWLISICDLCISPCSSNYLRDIHRTFDWIKSMGTTPSMKYPIHKYHTYLDISMLSHYPIRYPIYPIYTIYIYIYTPYNSHICIYIYIPDTINLLHLRLYSTCSLPHRYRSPWRTLRDAFDCAAPTCRASRSAPRGNWPSCRRRVGWGFPVKLWVYQRIGF